MTSERVTSRGRRRSAKTALRMVSAMTFAWWPYSDCATSGRLAGALGKSEPTGNCRSRLKQLARVSLGGLARRWQEDTVDSEGVLVVLLSATDSPSLLTFSRICSMTSSILSCLTVSKADCMSILAK